MKSFENKINEKYLELTEKMNEILNNKDYFIENKIDNNNEYTLDVYLSSNKKKVMTVVCRSMGFYNYNCETFYWGDCILPTNININELAKKIKKTKNKLKKMIIEKKYDDVAFLERILYYVSNNVFYINEVNIQDLIKYSCHVTDSMGILVQQNREKKRGIYYLVREITQIRS
jgi:hypothetical protein